MTAARAMGRRGGLRMAGAALLLALAAACGDVTVAGGNGGADGGGLGNPFDDITGGNGGGEDTGNGGGEEARLLYDPGPCDPHVGTELGVPWTAWDDRVNGGLSESHLAVEDEGGCFLRWTGALVASDAGPAAGLALDAEEAFLGGWNLLLIETRGDGTAIRAMFPREDQWQQANSGAEGDHWNFHGAVFDCGDGSGTWGQTVIDLNALIQDEGWGVEWERDNSQVRRIRIEPDQDAPYEWDCHFGRMELRR